MLFSYVYSKEKVFDITNLLELSTDGGELPVGLEYDYITNLYKAAAENLDDIDRIITDKSRDFTLDRIFKTDLTAIRMGIAEIKYTETNRVVVINETVEIAKKYGTDKSGGFVNGILAQVDK
jgi:N utilization substance protein B